MVDSTLKVSLGEFQDLVSSPGTVMAEGAYAFKVGRNQKWNPYPEDHDNHRLWQEGWDTALEHDLRGRDRREKAIRSRERGFDKW
jgi:hypothetical protein